jgi:hypothetical protein
LIRALYSDARSYRRIGTLRQGLAGEIQPNRCRRNATDNASCWGQEMILAKSTLAMNARAVAGKQPPNSS